MNETPTSDDQNPYKSTESAESSLEEAVDAAYDPAQLLLGKVLIIVVIAVIILIEVSLLAMTGMEVPDIIRLGLTVILGTFLYRGKEWARAVLACLLTIAMIFLISGVVNADKGDLDGASLNVPVLIGMVVIYTAMVLILVAVPAVHQFMKYQNEQPNQRN